MKNIFAFVLLIMSFVVTSSSLAFQNEPDGFRGIKWGTDISANTKEMTLVKEQGITKTYIRLNDKMSIGNAKLKRIEYIYNRDEFFAVRIQSVGLENRPSLISAFITRFGDNHDGSVEVGVYEWIGMKAWIAMICKKSKTMACDVTIFSKELMEKRKKKYDEKLKSDF